MDRSNWWPIVIPLVSAVVSGCPNGGAVSGVEWEDAAADLIEGELGGEVGIIPADIGEQLADTQGWTDVPCKSSADCFKAIDNLEQCWTTWCVEEAGVCAIGPKPDGAKCDDQNACTSASVCQQGTCVAVPGSEVSCDDQNVCTEDKCDPVAGCYWLPAAESCDDGNVCTKNDHCAAGKCVGEPVSPEENPACELPCEKTEDCAAYEDGDLCNGSLICVDGNCQVDPESVVVCPPWTGNECTELVCLPETGKCVLVPADGKPCDDGNVCTIGDTCVEGKCVGGDLNPECECSCDEDCLAFDDGNLCNGTLSCSEGKCVVTPGSVVECPISSSPCLHYVCDPATGECITTPLPDGSVCSDGDSCTSGDSCVGGVCVGTSAVVCDDGNPCTDDMCEPGVGCLYVPNENPCDDGNPCTLGDQCSGSVCVPGKPAECDDGNPCTDDACDLAEGCVHVPNNNPCDDGNECTVGDICSNGQCVPGQENVCQCSSDEDCAQFDDGNPCNGVLVCVSSKCEVDPATVVNCPDPNPFDCVTFMCNPKLGECEAANLADGVPCDDLNLCTADDVCSGGECQGTPVAVDDGNVCTQDTCDPETGVKHTPISGPCDDGDPCTGGDFCAAGKCYPGPENLCGECKTAEDCIQYEDGNKCNGTLTCVDGKCVVDPATVVTCEPSPSPCAEAVCEPATGKCIDVPVADGTPCDDGSVCTVGDACLGGECQGMPLVCDDGNPCTDDSCDPKQGCINLPNNAPCDDGDACTEGDVCSGGSCKPGAAVSCNDNNLCTTDKCLPDIGCVHEMVNCDDGNPETMDSCDPAVGCVHKLIDCDDGDPCTYDYFDPKTGECVHLAKDCDDGNPCTTDSCHPSTGDCIHVAKDCNDGNACTLDSCDKSTGECLHTEVNCDDSNACTEDVCDKDTGECLHTQIQCNDSNDCTQDICDPAVGCLYLPEPMDGQKCEDGDPCTEPDVCKGGTCVPGPIVCKEICTNGKDDDGDGQVDCIDSDCKLDPACDPNPVCQVDGKVQCGTNLKGNIATGMGQLTKYSCTDGMFLGNENIYEFVAPCTTEVSAKLTLGMAKPLTNGNVLILDAAKGCKGTSCIAAGKPQPSPFGQSVFLAVFNAVEGHKYYVVVDTVNPVIWESVEFTLLVSCECGGPPVEICNDKKDNDGDDLVDCDDPDCFTDPACVVPPPCTVDGEVSCGKTVYGILGQGQGELTKYSCTAVQYPGDEAIYEFTAACSGKVTVTATSANEGPFNKPDLPIPLNLVTVLILDAAKGCSGEACIVEGKNKPGPGGVGSVATFQAEHGAEYYIVVESISPIWPDPGVIPISEFTLSVSCECGGPPVEICDDKKDNDGDDLVDCDDPDCFTDPACVVPPPCTVDGEVSCGKTVYGTVGDGQGELTKYSCTAVQYPGDEAIYEFTAACSGKVTVTATSANVQPLMGSGGPVPLDIGQPPPFNLVTVLVLDAAKGCSGEACIVEGKNKPGPGGVGSVATFQAEHGAEYYIVVESVSLIWPNPGVMPSSKFALSVSCECGGSPVEICDDKKDNDGDGLVDCDDPECLVDPACIPLPTCTLDGEVSCGKTVYGTLGAGQGELTKYSCTFVQYPGDEAIYKFTAPCIGKVTVTAASANVEPFMEPDAPIPFSSVTVLVLDAAKGCSGEACIVAGKNQIGPGGGKSVATFQATLGAEYYIVVDSVSPILPNPELIPNSGFTLSVSCLCPLGL